MTHYINTTYEWSCYLRCEIDGRPECNKFAFVSHSTESGKYISYTHWYSRPKRWAAALSLITLMGLSMFANVHTESVPAQGSFGRTHIPRAEKWERCLKCITHRLYICGETLCERRWEAPKESVTCLRCSNISKGLAGTWEMITNSWVWRRRYGGCAGPKQEI